MTTVKFKNTQFTAEGHAKYNVNGPDVVCASVSILSFQLAQEILLANENNKLLQKPNITLEDGNVIVDCTPKKRYKDEITRLFEYAKTGFLLLQEKYPENVRVCGLTN